MSRIIPERNSTYYHEITRLLRNSLGDPEELHRTSPLFYCDSALEVLLATILTQATSDKNALRAWMEFKRVYAGPEQVLQAGEDLLYQVLCPAGLALQKTKTIFTILRLIKERLGDYSINSLKDNPERAWQFLMQLPGVGPKTAACTMLFGFGWPRFPVDVHIERIIKRLGWHTSPDNLVELQQKLGQEIPPELHAALHILLLNLGRRFCRPKQPNCNECPLPQHCPKLKIQ